MTGLVVISGCSGGGKSTLLAELADRGFAVVEEPGRRIVKQELEGSGAALPWVDMIAFARCAMEMGRSDVAAARANAGWIFFDRGMIDAAAALQYITGQSIPDELKAGGFYHGQVFLTPPWPEIYVTDSERLHGFDEAVAEYDRLAAVYLSLGYEVILLPKVNIPQRADFILDALKAGFSE
jgi:predicted ATPase